MKIKLFRIHLSSAGFTLIELAIVIAILGLLFAAFLKPLSVQQEYKASSETQNLLNQAQEALIGYALVNGHLPCPDIKPIPNGSESRKIDGTCDDDKGVLPWSTLGVARVDAWDHYFYYRVDATFSHSIIRFTISNAEGSSGINVKGENGVSIVSSGSNPVAIVISYGPNGYGAKNTTQATPANQLPAPSGVDEKENTDGNLTFVSHSPTPRGSANEFDDMLVWVPPKILINRMVQAERLP